MGMNVWLWVGVPLAVFLVSAAADLLRRDKEGDRAE